MMRLIATTFTGLMVGWSGVLGYWIQDNVLPVTSKFVEVVGPAHPGGDIYVRWVVDRHRACSATRGDIVIDVDGVRWSLGTQTFSSPPGPMGQDTYVTKTALPPDIPIGPAHLRVSLSYICNPVQYLWPIRDLSIPDIPFKITP